MKKIQVLMLITLFTGIITACGGGGGSSSPATNSGTTNVPPAESPNTPSESPNSPSESPANPVESPDSPSESPNVPPVESPSVPPFESSSTTSALQAALYFFNENAIGPINDKIQIPANSGESSAYINPVVWRGDSFVNDGLTIINGNLVTIPNLNTGFADAGDTIKYNLPQAYADMVLAWSGIEFESAFQQSKTYNNLANVLRWGMYYMMNCWQPDPNSGNPASSPNSYLVVQTGIGQGGEHALWAPNEVFEQSIIGYPSSLPKIQLGNSSVPYKRLAYYVNIAHPGPDIAGAMSAAMAAGATFFANSPLPSDQAFAKQLYQTSQQVLQFGQNMASGSKCNNGTQCVANNNLGYSYTTNGWAGNIAQSDVSVTYNDAPGVPNYYAGKLAIASLWIAQASNKIDGGKNYQGYLNQGESLLAKSNITIQSNGLWTLDWANFYYGAFLLLAKMDPTHVDTVSQSKLTYAQEVKNWISQLQTQAKNNPGGLSFLNSWEALRYAANSSFVATLTDKYLNITDFDNFALTQMNYIEGSNPASYNYQIGIQGTGTKNAANAHHATAQGSWTNSADLTNTANQPLYAHQLFGALVGGPSNANGTGYNPVASDYTTNEPTIDGNASFVGGLAAQYNKQKYITNTPFPPVKPANLQWLEFYADLLVESPTINYQGYPQQTVIAYMFNHSTWPAKLIYNQQFVMYFDFSDMPPGQTISAVQIQINDAPGMQNPIWTKIDNTGHYSLSFTTTAVTYPGGVSQDSSGFMPDCRYAQFVLTVPWPHNFNNDPSFKGLQTDPYEVFTQGTYSAKLAPNIAIYGSTTSNGTSNLLGGTPFSG